MQPMRQTGAHLISRRLVFHVWLYSRIKRIWLYEELLELVDMEARDLLSFYEFDVIIVVVARPSIDREDSWVATVKELTTKLTHGLKCQFVMLRKILALLRMYSLLQSNVATGRII